MIFYCNSCGGECRETVKDGKTLYRCKWCGREVEPDETPNRKNQSFVLDQNYPFEAAHNAAPATEPAKAPAAAHIIAPGAEPAQAPAAAHIIAPGASAANTVIPPVKAHESTAYAAPAQPANQEPRLSNFSIYGDSALAGEDLYEKVIPSVVEIQVRNSTASAAASGFVVSSKGLVLTNAHAVLDETGKLFDNIYVRVGERYYNAYPLALGEPRANQSYDTVDLCLLYVQDLENPTAVEFGNVNILRNGQRVYLVGNSLGEGTCITSGIISDKDRYVGSLSYPYIMTDAAANPGNSGGPLFNEIGELIAVLVAGITTAKGMNYAIPVNVVDCFLSYAINNTRLKDLDLGELNRYKDTDASENYSQTISKILGGIKILIDIVDYIINLFA
jgi:S1-C subfamily serine protease